MKCNLMKSYLFLCVKQPYLRFRDIRLLILTVASFRHFRVLTWIHTLNFHWLYPIPQNLMRHLFWVEYSAQKFQRLNVLDFVLFWFRSLYVLKVAFVFVSLAVYIYRRLLKRVWTLNASAICLTITPQTENIKKKNAVASILTMNEVYCVRGLGAHL